ncbi:hypothetical protein GN244_ATG07093 [Phytophthora infestans]|uniref:Transmembrane protein n=1 Tax=Phytophthora infestans TaxID=4787 RepID=A0A833SU13_PHYIN|nr:hypothetical protein GN244_ATG07093 [Phytophthora infestans]
MLIDLNDEWSDSECSSSEEDDDDDVPVMYDSNDDDPYLFRREVKRRAVAEGRQPGGILCDSSRFLGIENDRDVLRLSKQPQKCLDLLLSLVLAEQLKHKLMLADRTPLFVFLLTLLSFYSALMTFRFLLRIPLATVLCQLFV